MAFGFVTFDGFAGFDSHLEKPICKFPDEIIGLEGNSGATGPLPLLLKWYHLYPGRDINILRFSRIVGRFRPACVPENGRLLWKPSPFMGNGKIRRHEKYLGEETFSKNSVWRVSAGEKGTFYQVGLFYEWVVWGRVSDRL